MASQDLSITSVSTLSGSSLPSLPSLATLSTVEPPTSPASATPAAPTKSETPIGYDGKKLRYIYHPDGPFKGPLTPRRAARRLDALGQSVFLKAKDSYFASPKEESASEFIADLEKALGSKLCLKGSWTNPETDPNDLDFGAWVFETPPHFEDVIRQKILSFVIARIKRVAPGTHWVPLEEYFKEEIIYDEFKRVSILIYRGPGIDLTFYLRPELFSTGLADGRWWSVTGDPIELVSKGGTFVTEKASAEKADFLIRNHLNEIDDASKIHNWHLHYSYGILRLGQLVDIPATDAAIQSLDKEKSAQKCAQKVVNFQKDHIKHDEGKILHLLIYYTIHAFNEHMCAFITQVWRQAAEQQNIEEMDPFCNVIESNPHLIPHVLAVVRWILLAEGADAYSFKFNPENPRPLLGIKIRDKVNYLLLPNHDSSPIQLGRQFLKSRKYLLAFASDNHLNPDCSHLAFLKPILRGLGLSTKYLSRTYNFDEMRSFYASTRADTLQGHFGRYPEARSFLKEVPEAESNALVPYVAEATPVEDPRAVFAALVGGSTKSVTATTTPPLLQFITQDFSPSASPVLAVPAPKEEKRDHKDGKTEAQASVSKSEDMAESIGSDLQGAKALAEKYKLLSLEKVIGWIEQLAKMEKADEKTVKTIYGLLVNIRQQSEEILANKEIQRTLGPNYFKEFINQQFLLIIKKGLAYPTPELFDVTLKFYLSWAKHLSEAVEHEAVLFLIKVWMELKPKKETALYNQGRELISLAFQKNITGDRATFNAIFEVLAASKDPLHLRLAYGGLNQLLLNLGKVPDPKVPERIIVLLTTTLMKPFEELYRPLFKTILKLYNYDSLGFETAFSQVKAMFLPGIMHAIQHTANDLNYNGDERLLFKTLNCLQKYHTSTSIKLAVQAFDAVIEKGQSTGFKGQSLTQLELIGSLAGNLIKASHHLRAPVEWKDDQMRLRWLTLALRLQAVGDEQAEDFDGSESYRFRELATELMAHFKESWSEETLQEKVAILNPKKVVIKKEVKPKESVQRVASLADLLLKTLQTTTIADAKPRIARIIEISKSLIGAMQKEAMDKEQQAKIRNSMAQIHCLLSYERHGEIASTLHQIFDAASSQGLLEGDQTTYMTWVIKCYLRNIDKDFDFAKMQKLVTLAKDLYAKTSQKGSQEDRLKREAKEIIFEVYKLLYTRFPNQKVIKPILFSPLELQFFSMQHDADGLYS